jgi:hypothetical protein
MKTLIPTDYKYLLDGPDGYTEEYMSERLLYWYRRSENIIKNLKLENVARIDNQRLIFMVLSYFADIARLKNFHPNIGKTRKVVNFAYSFFWFLRSSPIQLKDAIPGRPGEVHSIFVNEMAVVHIWIAEFVRPLNLGSDLETRYLKELFYYFRYRNYNAQSLEAILTALVLGSGRNPFYDDNGVD